MTDTERLMDLLVAWEESRQRGQTQTAEQLCPDNPALQAELRQRISKRERFLDMIDSPGATISDADVPGNAAVPRLEGYEFLELIGFGGMGVVYKARQAALHRLVAVKMILGGPFSSGQDLDRFRFEAEAVARLQHPNIVQIFEIGEQDHRPYLVLEFVSGGSLAQHLKATPLAARRVAELLLQLARAVQHAHQQGIVHRDLKPANILLTEQGVPKIADFGLAKQLDRDAGFTRTGSILGSPSYMAPEQAEGRLDEVGFTTDIYALGAILYELLTGRAPFIGGTILDTLDQVRNRDPVPPRILQPGVPKDLETICLKCLEKRPQDRYASAEALAGDLENFLAGESIQARPPSWWDNVSRAIGRRNFDPRFRSYGTLLIAASPFPLLIHLAMYWRFHADENFPVIITWTSIIVVLLVQSAMFRGNKEAVRQVPANQRRHFATVWGANTLHLVVSWFIVWLVVRGQDPNLLFLVYPLWVLQLGHTYFAFASEAGGFYVTGSLLTILALAMVFFLPWTPLLVGLLMFSNMLSHGLILWSGKDLVRAGG